MVGWPEGHLAWNHSTNPQEQVEEEDLRSRLTQVHVEKRPLNGSSGIFVMVYTKKVKLSHTCYRALGLELITVYRQWAHMWLEAIHPALGCHYFPPGLRLPSQPKSVTAHRPVPNYTAWWQRHMRVSSLSKAVTWKRTTVKPHRPGVY